MDRFGDHTLACPRTGLLARQAKVVECAWIRVAREALGPEGQVVPQQWLAHTTALGVAPGDRRRLDMLVRSHAHRPGPVLRWHLGVATGQPQPCSADVDGAGMAVPGGSCATLCVPVPAGHEVRMGAQIKDGGACCQSPCNKQWRGRRLAARGQLPRPQARQMPSRLTAGRGVLQPGPTRDHGHALSNFKSNALSQTFWARMRVRSTGGGW